MHKIPGAPSVEQPTTNKRQRDPDVTDEKELQEAGELPTKRTLKIELQKRPR